MIAEGLGWNKYVSENSKTTPDAMTYPFRSICAYLEKRDSLLELDKIRDDSGGIILALKYL